MEKKKVGIVGFGGMGRHHYRWYKNSDVVELAGIYDIKQSAVDYAESENIHAYASLAELLADDAIEIVLVATPNDVHIPIAIEAMKAGKHVISEKPVTVSSEELKVAFEASEKYGRLFTVHQNRRFDADFLAVKNLYQSNEIGDIFCIESRVHGSRGIPGDWRKEKAHGGGMMLDWGVHLIDQMMQMIDSPIDTIYCVCDHITNKEVDDGFKMDTLFENGLRFRIEVSTSNFISLPRWYVLGRGGSAKIDTFKSDVNIVTCSQMIEENVAPVVTAAGLTKTMAPRSEKTITERTVPKPPSDVHDYYRNFCAAIDGKATQLVTHEQMMQVMRIMETAFESDRLGRPVKFEG